MKTTFDILDIFYPLLNQSALKTAITGGVYKSERPLNSELEDVVIGTLPITTGTVQICVVNVNIHVSDLKLTIGGVEQYQPNIARLKVLAAIAAGILETYVSSNYILFITNLSLLKEETTHQHYINIRVEIQIHKTN